MKIAKKSLSFLLAITMAFSLMVGVGEFSNLKVEAQAPSYEKQMVFVAMHGSGKVEAYDVASGQYVKTIASGISQINDVKLASDGSMYVCTGNPGTTGYIYKYNPTTGQLISTIESYADQRITSIKIVGNTLYASVCDIGLVRVYDLTTGTYVKDIVSIPGNSVVQIDVVNGKLYVPVYQLNVVYVYNAVDGTYLSAYGLGIPFAVAVNSQEHIFISSHSGNIAAYRPGGVTVVSSVNTALNMAFAPNGVLYVSEYGANKITSWDAYSTDANISEITGVTVSNPSGMDFVSYSQFYAFDQDRMMLVAMAGTGKIEAFDMKTGNHIRTIASGINGITDIAVADDGYVYASTSTGFIYKINLGTGKIISTVINSGGQRITSIKIVGNIIYLSLCDLGVVQTYNLTTGAYITNIVTFANNSITQIDVVNGKLYVTLYQSNAVGVYDATTGTNLAYLGYSIPFGVAVNSNDHIFISSHHGSVASYIPGGATVISSGLNLALYLDIAPDGSLVVSENGANKIGFYDAYGTDIKYREISGGVVNAPCGTAFVSYEQVRRFFDKSILYVAMHGTGKVEAYDVLIGKHINTIASDISEVNDVAFSDDGFMYVCTGNPGTTGYIYKYNPTTGQRISTLESYTDQRITSIKIVGNTLYASVCDIGLVRVYDLTTQTYVKDIVSVPNNSIVQIEVVNGKLYVPIYQSNIVYVYNAIDGTYLSANGLGVPLAVAVNSQEHIFISSGTNTVSAYRPGGASVVSSVIAPVYMDFAPNGELYVSENGANKITSWNAYSTDSKISEISDSSISSPMGMSFYDLNPVEFGSYKVSTDNYISNVSPNLTVDAFKQGLIINSGTVVVKDKEGNPITNGTITTGSIVESSYNGKSYTIVIFGDVDGNGLIGLSDLTQIRDHLLESDLIEDDFALAADIYGEGSITLNSLVGVMAFVSESGAIDQNNFVKKN